MTNSDIKILADALQHKETEKNTKTQINRILRNKNCTTIIRELKILMQEMQNKDRCKALLVVVFSILYKNSGLLDDIQKALTAENLISNLYGGLCIFLSGKNSSMQLNIKLTASQFPNRYDYLTRFSGQFAYPEIREVLYAVKILAMSDRTKFEELAFKDNTRLILLNMTSFYLNEFPSDTLITRLLKDGDELQANIGFYFAVWDITRDIHDYEQFRTNPNSPSAKTKRQINKNIKNHLKTFYGFYNYCSIERKVSLLINYILFENAYPTQFGHWLMEEELQTALISEITSSNKIKNLSSLSKLVRLIHDFPCKGANGICQKKNPLYAAVLKVLNTLIEKRELYHWDNPAEIDFQSICKALPQRYLKQLYKFLKKTSMTLMVSELDEMVRFSIYLEDKRQWDICQGMMRVIDAFQINETSSYAK